MDRKWAGFILTATLTQSVFLNLNEIVYMNPAISYRKSKPSSKRMFLFLKKKIVLTLAAPTLQGLILSSKQFTRWFMSKLPPKQWTEFYWYFFMRVLLLILLQRIIFWAVKSPKVKVSQDPFTWENFCALFARSYQHN